MRNLATRFNKFLFVTFFAVFAYSAEAQIDSISLPDSIWAGDSVTWVRKVPFYCEGPAYEASTGYVYFTQQIGNSTPNWPVWRVKPGVDTGIVWYNTYQNNGLEFDYEERLIVAQNGRLSRLTEPRFYPTLTKQAGNGGPPDTATLVASGNNGVTFTQANDLSIGKNGAIFFTSLGSAVYYLSPGKVLYTATNANATIAGANGIEWLPWDTTSLYVNSTNSNKVYKYSVGTNGTLSNRTDFVASITQPDGGTYDSLGNRYVASYGNGEIRVYNPSGTYLGRIALRRQSGIYDSVQSSGRVGRPGNADNAVFGGTDMKTLYMTGDGGLFSIRLKVPGVRRTAPYTAIRPSRPQGSRNVTGVEMEPRDVRGRLLSTEENVPALSVPVREGGR